MNIDFIKLFKYGACNGDLDIMQKILNISSNIFLLSTLKNTFKNTCCCGHLNVAQWLYQIKPDIDNSAENDHAFRSA